MRLLDDIVKTVLHQHPLNRDHAKNRSATRHTNGLPAIDLVELRCDQRHHATC